MLTERWHRIYREKLVSIDEALSHIKSGDRIPVGMAAAEPSGLLSRLHTMPIGWRT